MQQTQRLDKAMNEFSFLLWSCRRRRKEWRDGLIVLKKEEYSFACGPRKRSVGNGREVWKFGQVTCAKQRNGHICVDKYCVE